MLGWEDVGEQCSGNAANPILYRILAFTVSYLESFLLQIRKQD